MKDRLSGVAAIIFFLITGLLVFNDYGLSWDEPQQRLIGNTSFEYIFGINDNLTTFKDRDYGVAYELPLIFLEKAFNLSDTRTIFLMRHLVTHLLFLWSAWCFYLLALRLTGRQILALFAVLMLLLHPRIYAHSFFNTKDIPFLAVLIFSLYSVQRAFSSQKLSWFIPAGILSGLLVNLRVAGLMIPVAVAVFLITDLVMAEKYHRRNLLLKLVLFTFCCTAALYVSWPYLWPDPVNNLLSAVKNMASFRWNMGVFFLGNLVAASDLPHSYLPVWFTVTTPLLFLLFGLTGMIVLLINLVRKPMQFISNTGSRQFLLYTGVFLAPPTLAILLDSIVYDGWRQFYFIYPAFVLTGIYGLSILLPHASGKLKRLVYTFLVLNFLYLISQLIYLHPYQHVYFNEVMSCKPEAIRHKMEMDYWGTSYYEAAQFILKNDPDTAAIYFENSSGDYNMLLLKDEERTRVQLKDSREEAEWWATNHRWHPWEYEVPGAEKVFVVRRRNNTLVEVWKMK